MNENLMGNGRAVCYIKVKPLNCLLSHTTTKFPLKTRTDRQAL